MANHNHFVLLLLLHRIRSLMEFDSKTVAEQMTLLDAELFQKIEVMIAVSFRASKVNQAVISHSV